MRWCLLSAASWLALWPQVAFSLPPLLPASLDRRQQSGLVDPSMLLRRGYHRSEVLDGWLYIDGGELSYISPTGTNYQYSTSLLAIDLSQDFNATTARVVSTDKPPGAPVGRLGGIWVDQTKKLLYMGFAGTCSVFGDQAHVPRGLWAFTPDGKGGGAWKNLTSSAPDGFVTNPRPFDGLVASGGGKGYFFGGFAGDMGQEGGVTVEKPISGMLVYDFEKNTLENKTVTGVSTQGYTQRGSMVHVPNFGREGILISVGGCQRGRNTEGEDFLVSTSIAQVYDIATSQWHEQSTTGGAPEARKDYCMAGAASTNKTFEILVYAGWGGHLGPSAVPFDEAYVLSLPAFHWTKANYKALRPRHGLSCSYIGGGKVATIGGVDSTQSVPSDIYRGPFNTVDPFKQTIGIFDLATLQFTDAYKGSSPNWYTLAPDIQAFYNGNGRLPIFDSPALSDIFTVENFTAQAAGGGAASAGAASPGGGPSTINADSPGRNVGAIAGGVVGGVAAVTLIAFLVWFCLRRRRRDLAVAASAGAMVQALSSAVPAKHPGGAAGEYEAVPQTQAPSTAELNSQQFQQQQQQQQQQQPLYNHSHQLPMEYYSPVGTRYELQSHQPVAPQRGVVHEIQGYQSGGAQALAEENYKYNIRF